MEKNYNWDNLRSLYVEWVSNTQLKNFIQKYFLWKGLSLWWLCNLTQKDNVNNPHWYHSLYKKIYKKQDVTYAIKRKNRMLHLLKDIFILLMTKFYLEKKDKIESQKKIIFFHSIDTNFQKQEELLVDRLYMSSPLIDHKYGSESHYLIDVNLSIKRILKLKFYKNKYKLLGKNYHILNNYLNIIDILNIYVYVFLIHIKYLFVSSINKKGLEYYIKGVDCEKILEPYLRESFYTMHASMLRALAFEKFFRQFNSPQTVITTSEFMPNVRGIYYLLHKGKVKHNVVTIQHALASKNKLFCCHAASEFDKEGLGNGLNSSPIPDRYFVQGNFFYNILREYYQEKRISIIGCLKFDNLSNENNFKKKVIKTILVAPSIGDVESIIDLMNDINLAKNFKIIISPHPNNIEDTYLKFKKCFDYFSDVEFCTEKLTLSLIKDSDLVLCGHSGVALDSIMMGTPSARIFSKKWPTMIDFEDGIPVFSSGRKLEEWILSFSEKYHDKNEYNRTLSNFFYKIDGNTSERLWNLL